MDLEQIYLQRIGQMAAEHAKESAEWAMRYDRLVKERESLLAQVEELERTTTELTISKMVIPEPQPEPEVT
jgi:hypothetical protein